MAESEEPVTPVQPAQLSRRMIIGLGLAAPTLAVPWLAGCSSDDPGAGNPLRAAETPAAPASSPAATPTTSPSPTAAASSPPPAAAAPEQALAAIAAVILGGPQRQQLSQHRRALLTFLRDAHSAHAHAIVNPLPTQAPVKLGGQSLNASLALLSHRETVAAGRYREAALRTAGSDALLWGSLAIAAGGFATALASGDPPATHGVRARKPVEVLPEVAAVQELVRQLHAMVYGYQLAIGKMTLLSNTRTRAEHELLAERIFRDRLIAWLRKRSAEVPAAEPAYVPSVVPHNAATAGRLIMRMQTALQPFCGLWLAAAASQADRRQALGALGSAMKTARSWGSPLDAWPGWSS